MGGFLVACLPYLSKLGVYVANGEILVEVKKVIEFQPGRAAFDQERIDPPKDTLVYDSTESFWRICGVWGFENLSLLHHLSHKNEQLENNSECKDGSDGAIVLP